MVNLHQIWQELNQRQQVYLQILYELDQKNEWEEKQRRLRGDPNQPAAEWRPMRYEGIGESFNTRLRALLRGVDVVDPGTGSTFEALERRGLILRHYRPAYKGAEPTLYLEVTRLGRRVIREVFPELKPRPRPAPNKNKQLAATTDQAQAQEENLELENYLDLAELGKLVTGKVEELQIDLTTLAYLLSILNTSSVKRLLAGYCDEGIVFLKLVWWVGVAPGDFVKAYPGSATTAQEAVNWLEEYSSHSPSHRRRVRQLLSVFSEIKKVAKDLAGDQAAVDDSGPGAEPRPKNSE